MKVYLGTALELPLFPQVPFAVSASHSRYRFASLQQRAIVTAKASYLPQRATVLRCRGQKVLPKPLAVATAARFPLESYSFLSGQKMGYGTASSADAPVEDEDVSFAIEDELWRGRNQGGNNVPSFQHALCVRKTSTAATACSRTAFPTHSSRPTKTMTTTTSTTTRATSSAQQRATTASAHPTRSRKCTYPAAPSPCFKCRGVRGAGAACRRLRG